MEDEEYARFLDAWPGLLASVDINTGMFKHLSHGWQRVLGWSREELLAKPFIEFVHPDDREATTQVAQLAEDQDIARFVNRYERKGGGYRWIAWTSSVERTLPQAERLIHATAYDITDHVETRHQLEHALFEAEGLRGVVEATSDYVGMATPEGIVTYINQAGLKMLGRTAEEVVGTVLRGTRTPGDQQRMKREAIPYALEHGVWSGEGDLITSDGTAIPISQVVVRLNDAAGELSAVATIVRDISRAKQLEAELRAQTERLRAAVQVMSTPFIPITDEIVVMPLIGQMDADRAEQVMEVALDGVGSSGVRVVILDVTGLTTVDSMVGASLIKTARALRLLGARTILTGIQPAVAQTLVGLGLDLSGTTSHATLQSAIASAQREFAARK